MCAVQIHEWLSFRTGLLPALAESKLLEVSICPLFPAQTAPGRPLLIEVPCCFHVAMLLESLDRQGLQGQPGMVGNC